MEIETKLGKWIRFGNKLHNMSNIKFIESNGGTEIKIGTQDGFSFYQSFSSEEVKDEFFEKLAKLFVSNEVLFDVTSMLKKYESNNRICL
jgi:hypothetical protein